MRHVTPGMAATLPAGRTTRTWPSRPVSSAAPVVGERCVGGRIPVWIVRVTSPVCGSATSDVPVCRDCENATPASHCIQEWLAYVDDRTGTCGDQERSRKTLSARSPGTSRAASSASRRLSSGSLPSSASALRLELVRLSLPAPAGGLRFAVRARTRVTPPIDERRAPRRRRGPRAGADGADPRPPV